RAYNQNYVDSPFGEETMFLEAMSEYHLTDVFSKDQQRTYHAIQKFDQYFAQFPQGEFRDEAILKYQVLMGKIEKKAYDNAYLYIIIVVYTRDFNDAIVELDNIMMYDIERV